ncbi:DUF5691 domain-containing protein [Prescottella subtropica]|uniref:DUF5691 domain-containing protein n=1 Tax=Prescottella subtropica TaxID=2545757 RepID=UPI0010F7A7CF|nr:DUF5691 domain-containing protein [Prescottella subtropica]
MNRPYPEKLAAAALLGTARSTLPLTELHTASAAEVLDADPATTLLAAAALESAFLSGAAVPTTVPVPAPAPTDPRPALPDAAVERLRSLLVVDSSLIPEWFSAAAGFRPSTHLLVEVLEAALRRTARRDRLVELAGPRGQWLAARNPDWAPLRLPDPSDDEDWRHGTPAVRLLWFAALRRTDPAAATALLATAWTSEKADMRATLLAALADGLGAGDESLLERALDDRGQRVRQTAVGLLARLPGSAFGQRMAQRLRDWVSVSGTVVTVTLPDVQDDAARRDGLDERTARRPDALLTAAVQAAPLSVWADLGVSTESLPHITVAEPFTTATEIAWSTAVAVQGDTDWALALLRRDGTVTAPVARHLPRDVVVARLLATPDGAVPDANLLEALPAPWPHHVAAAVLGAVYAARAPLAELRYPIDLLGHRAPFEFQDALSEAATRAGHLDRLALFAAAADILTHRRHLHQELT